MNVHKPDRGPGRQLACRSLATRGPGESTCCSFFGRAAKKKFQGAVQQILPRIAPLFFCFHFVSIPRRRGFTFEQQLRTKARHQCQIVDTLGLTLKSKTMPPSQSRQDPSQIIYQNVLLQRKQCHHFMRSPSNSEALALLSLLESPDSVDHVAPEVP